jgi:2,4-dienoyl-CoA reductase-like NADH-dependent reductase (Old Yellow Enzyme family)
MAPHEKFVFRAGDELLAKAGELGLKIPFLEDVSVLLEPATAADRNLPNRLAVLPIEAADGTSEGAPTDGTIRRYERYAAGGSGMIWVEATAVRRDGRSNPRQLMLTDGTEDAFKKLVGRIRDAAARDWGPDHEPLLVLQLTHSGRFAKPDGKPAPLIVHRSPVLDPMHGLAADYPVLTDEALAEIQDDFVNAADLAASAGFDGVDIKACHGYLVSELLAAFTRTGSRYGGPFENRTRFLVETVRRIRQEVPRLLVTSRLSAADMVPFPYGFGMDPNRRKAPSLKETKELLSLLEKEGVRFLALSMGIPAWKAHFGRPFDKPVAGAGVPDEHPLEGVARHLRFASELQRTFPRTAVVGAGYSWLRRFFPNIGAAIVKSGGAAVIGLGRGALAYPDFPKDLAARGRLSVRNVCTTCSLCSNLLRQQKRVGCVLRDPEYRGAR